MKLLEELSFTPNKMVNELISPFQVKPLLEQLPHWELVVDDEDEEYLLAEFKTGNYVKAIAFTNAIAEIAEEVDHHPKIVVEYAKVTVYWWTHTLHGLHQNDFIMAARTSSLFNANSEA